MAADDGRHTALLQCPVALRHRQYRARLWRVSGNRLAESAADGTAFIMALCAGDACLLDHAFTRWLACRLADLSAAASLGKDPAPAAQPQNAGAGTSGCCGRNVDGPAQKVRPDANEDRGFLTDRFLVAIALRRAIPMGCLTARSPNCSSARTRVEGALV